MAYVQSDLDALEKAIATGAAEVRYADGRTVRYRSLQDMRAVQKEIRAALGYREASRVIVVEHER
jgi:hypothetical protein